MDEIIKCVEADIEFIKNNTDNAYILKCCDILTIKLQDIKDKNFLLTMGDMNIRKSLSDKIILKGGRVPTLVHPSAEISQFALISPLGVIVDSQTVIQADCIIDEGVYICSHSMICHQTHLEAYVFVAPHALIGARLNIRDFVFVGQNATLISTKVK